MAHFFTACGKSYDAEVSTIRELLDVWRLKKAIGAKVNGVIMDVDVPLAADAEITPVMPEGEEGLDLLRHSCAHLMAHAVLRLYPDAKFGMGHL